MCPNAKPGIRPTTGLSSDGRLRQLAPGAIGLLCACVVASEFSRSGREQAIGHLRASSAPARAHVYGDVRVRLSCD